MMIPERVSLKCLFCGLVLDVDEKIVSTIKSGDQIKCNYCGELNDFDSMLKVAEEEAFKVVKNEALKLTEEAFKKNLGKFFK